MKEKPILFSGPMVKAILEGRKTMTRRIMKPQPESPIEPGLKGCWYPNQTSFRRKHYATESNFRKGVLLDFLPYQVGMKLWVRETWFSPEYESKADSHYYCHYRATEDPACWDGPWRPSIHMPRWASRITLEVTAVRVERLQDITEEDAINEGSQIPCIWLPPSCQQGQMTEKDQFAKIWDSINGKKHPWKDNCWVWVIEFKRL